MSYELKPEDIFGFASEHADRGYHQKGDELVFKYCPYCHGGSHGDKETFSINLKSGAYCCLRSSCDKKGHFVQLARDFAYQLDFGEIKKYRQFPKGSFPKKIDNTAVQYLADRCISRETVEKYFITASKDRPDVIVFPFYDHNKNLIMMKYRNTKYQRGQHGSKEWFERDCKPILFGMMQATEYDKPLIITEGQIDSLSLAECGIPNAVSVPGGCTNFNWYGHCAEWIQRFPEVIIFGDYENGHMTLVDKIRTLVGKPVKEIDKSYYLGEKDANDILKKYGRSAIIDAVSNAKISEIAAVKRLADVETVDVSSMPKIKTGIFPIDKVLGGLYFGQVTLISGKRGEGKSTFGSQIIANAIDQKYPVFIYSGELPDYYFKNWLDLQIAGSANVESVRNSYGTNTYRLAEGASEKINAWYYDKAYIFDNSYVGDDEYSGLLDIIEKAICQYGIRLVFIDNLMTAISCDVNSDLYRAQSVFLKSLSLRIAKKYNVAVILIAHPKKTNQDFDNDTVSGSADITNLVDNVLCYQRVTDREYDSEIMITKNRNTGKLLFKKDAIPMRYIECCKRVMAYEETNEKIYSCFAGNYCKSDYSLPWEE